MTGQLIPFDASGGGQLPAHIAAAFADEDSNMAGRASIDQLSYRGKIWRVILKGEEHPLMRTDNDSGEMMPLNVVTLVVLDINKNRSRSYYPGAYSDGQNQAPTCYSADGITPDASVPAQVVNDDGTVSGKQSATCATCQWSAKGSKITPDGKQTTACSPFKRIAVVPSQRIADHPAMLLRLAQTSVWDKDMDGRDGWYAWDQYVDMLRARGAKHSSAVETRVKFDISVPYPKLVFQASRWLDANEIAAAKARLVNDKDVIETILSGAGGRDGVAGQPAAAPAGGLGAPPAHVAAANVPVNTAPPVAAPAPVATPVAAPVAPPVPPKAPPVPPPVPVKVFPPEGWLVHPSDPAYFYKGDEVLTKAQLEERVAAEPVPAVVPPPAPVAPPAPAARKPRAKAPVEAPAAAPVQAAAPATVKAEPVDDGFGASSQPPAAAATPTAATPVATGAPAGLSALLDGWDN
jgi:hypothetical protein